MASIFEGSVAPGAAVVTVVMEVDGFEVLSRWTELGLIECGW